ncbi:MAG TPA: serpin family protein [Polyangiaceae bacterium]
MTSRFALLATLALGLLAGCSSSSSDSSGDLAQAKSSLSRDTSPPTTDVGTLATDNTKFAVAAYGQLAKADGNLFFSPYSISSALAMEYAGAKGQTATDMATALSFSLPQDKLHPAFDAIDLALDANAATKDDSEGAPLTLQVANSIWAANDLTFVPSYLDVLAKDYGAGVYLEDFGNTPKAVKDIDGWVMDKTNDKIDHLVDGAIDGDTRMVLVNAVYFYGNWAVPFETSDTQDGSFTTAAGGQVTVPMMHGSSFRYGSVSTPDFDAVELPYVGNAVMDIVMPKAGTLATFEASLDAGKLASTFDLVKSSGGGETNLAIPKFGYKGDVIELNSLLGALGMGSAFDDGADFSGISTTESLHIDQVIHKAFLSVDEKGTEAAAATAVTNKDAAIAQQSITIDHPFLFFIRETTTNTVLFAGRISDPTQ